MLRRFIAKIEVAEVYSPPRVIAMAKRMGMKAGWASDVTTKDQDVRAWDFNQLEMRNRAVRKLLRDEPTLFIGSQMCTAFSKFSNINYKDMSQEEVGQRVKLGRKHLEFCTKVYEMRWRAARSFIHEHLAEARPWDEQCIKRMLNKLGGLQIRQQTSACMG